MSTRLSRFSFFGRTFEWQEIRRYPCHPRVVHALREFVSCIELPSPLRCSMPFFQWRSVCGDEGLELTCRKGHTTQKQDPAAFRECGMIPYGGMVDEGDISKGLYSPGLKCSLLYAADVWLARTSSLVACRIPAISLLKTDRRSHVVQGLRHSAASSNTI